MAIDIKTIVEYLESQSLKFQIRENGSGSFIHTGFATQRYESPTGEKHLHLYIVLEENGEFIRIVAPHCYLLPEEAFQRDFFKTLLLISSKSKMVQFSCENPSLMDIEGLDDETLASLQGEEWISATVEMPIEDGTVTETQLLRGLFALVKILEYYHPVIHNVSELGEIDFEIVENAGLLKSLMEQLIEIDGMEDSSEELESQEDEGSKSDEDSESDEDSDDFGDFV